MLRLSEAPFIGTTLPHGRGNSLHKANRDNNVAATLMNIYLECNDKESFNKVLSAIIGMTFDEFLGFCIEDLEVEINTDGKDNIIDNWLEITKR